MADTRLQIAGSVATVIIDRPPVNALTLASYLEITGVFETLGAREDVSCIVLTGAGDRAFCAGFDYRQFNSAGASEDDPRRPEVLRTMFETIRNCPLPVVAAVNGPAIGAGCVLAAVCDIRLAADTARFGLPEIDFGRIGGAAYLAPLVSPDCLRYMALTGLPLSAQLALRVGLVWDLVELAALPVAAAALSAKLASKPRPALAAMKTALGQLAGRSIVDGYRFEQEQSVALRKLLEGGGR